MSLWLAMSSRPKDVPLVDDVEADPLEVRLTCFNLCEVRLTCFGASDIKADLFEVRLTCFNLCEVRLTCFNLL